MTLPLRKLPLSSLALAGFIALVPFEHNWTALRTCLLWTSAGALIWESFRLRLHNSLNRRLPALLFGMVSILAVALVILLVSSDPAQRGKNAIMLLARAGPFGVVLPILLVLAKMPLKAASPTDSLISKSLAARLDLVLWLPIFSWLAWLTLASAYSISPAASLRLFFREAGAFILGYALVRIKASAGKDQVRSWLSLLIAVGTVIALLAIFEIAVAYRGPQSWSHRLLSKKWIREELTAQGARIVRAQYPFESHNRLGSFLLAVALLIPPTLILTPKTKIRVALFAAGILCLVGIVLTGTRGAMIGAAAGLAVWLAVRPKIGAVLVIGGIAGLLLFPSPLRRHVFTIFDSTTYNNPSGSVQFRVYAWKISLRMIRDRPFLGFGYGWTNFETLYSAYNADHRDTEEKPHAHNNFLEIACETGLIGLAIFLAYQGALVGGAIFLILKSQRGTLERHLAWAILGLLIGLHVFGMTNYSLRRNVGFEIWMAWAIAHTVLIGTLTGIMKPPMHADARRSDDNRRASAV